MDYQFKKIEQDWQKFWADNQTFKTENTSTKPKYYVLDMFPYPSGAGLHVGHPLGYIASDIFSRYKRLKGFNVLHPMGYDAFGLPAEQYAIQTGQHPAVTTEANLARYRQQLDNIGFSYDWSREIKTTDAHYYKWTQWIFIQLFNSWYNKLSDKAESIDSLIALFEKEGNASVQAVCEETAVFTAAEWKALSENEQQLILLNYRLAYTSEAWVNWCPALGTVLANDEVKDGVSERGGHPVERKRMPQWSLRITAYADRLLKGLEEIDWTESIKESQRNWIGKSEGTSLVFSLQSAVGSIEVFTTRPDTVFGVSFVTLAPEHELVAKITTTEYKKAVDEYVELAKNRSERERQADVKNITGQFTGAYVVHPFNGAPIPVWIGDYVLAGYGTGAVMAVPGHDSRDYAFAKHFNLPIMEVVQGGNLAEEAYEPKEGKLINSDFLNGLEVKQAIKKAITLIEEKGLGKGKVNFRLRDAAFGRQRYWGEPIPVYYKEGVPYVMDEADLPLVLPEVDKFLPTESGEPPLARAENWTYTPPQPSPEGRELDSANSGTPRYETGDKTIWPILKEHSRENRKNPTEAEAILWKELRGDKLGVHIRRQHPILSYIADFVCIRQKLVIEVDGGYHEAKDQQAYDEQRTLAIEELGFKVIRFTNDAVINNLQGVLSEIKQTLKVLPVVEDLGGVSYPLETTTMPGWAGSSWYFLRYMDAQNDQAFASADALKYWQQVDLYMGGAEHATGHLLYVRFWTKFLFDLGLIPVDEPAKKLINQGMIQGRSNFMYRVGQSKQFVSYGLRKDYDTTAIHVDVNIVENDVLNIAAFKKWRAEYADAEFVLEDGKYICGSEVEKMSKSKWNVVNPDDIIERYGADTLRMYEMFLGPLEQSKPWNTNGIEGVFKFLRKFWKLFHDDQFNFVVSDAEPTKEELKSLHKVIRKVEEDIERFSFNTSVSTFMICVNELGALKCNKRAILQELVITLSPYAPHICEELWALLGNAKGSLSFVNYPVFNEAYLSEDAFDYPISMNGKVKTKLNLSLSMEAADVEQAVIASEEVQRLLAGQTPKKIIVVKGKIVNMVL